MPSVSEHPSATAIPSTSRPPKPRTIGTGEKASTAKPPAVAVAATTIAGAPRRAVRSTASGSEPPARSSSWTRACSCTA